MNDIRIVDDPDLQPEYIIDENLHLPKEPSEGVKILSFAQLESDYPLMRPAIIDGLFRSGEVVNVISSPKIGKSHLVGQLSWSIISGTDFVGFEIARQGPVLLVDNELHRETITARHRALCRSMGIDEAQFDELHVIPLRGVLCDVLWLRKHLAGIQPGKYAAIILDAFYKFLPAGISENDNASMAQVYATLDVIAAELDCAIICVHHSSKGEQGGKSITDVGAGAGSISRSADTHIIIRPHQDDGLFVVEAVTRSFKSPEPITARLDHPLWLRSDEAPVVRNPAIASREKREAEKQQQKASSEVADVNKLLAAIPSSGIGKTELRSKLPWGNPKFETLLRAAEHTWKVVQVRRYRKKNGKRPLYKVERLQLCVQNALDDMPPMEPWNPNGSKVSPKVSPILSPEF